MNSTFYRIFGLGPYKGCPSLPSLRRGGLVSVYVKKKRKPITRPLAHDDYTAAVMMTAANPPSYKSRGKDEWPIAFKKRVRDGYTKKFLQNLRLAADHTGAKS